MKNKKIFVLFMLGICRCDINITINEQRCDIATDSKLGIVKLEIPGAFLSGITGMMGQNQFTFVEQYLNGLMQQRGQDKFILEPSTSIKLFVPMNAITGIYLKISSWREITFMDVIKMSLVLSKNLPNEAEGLYDKKQLKQIVLGILGTESTNNAWNIKKTRIKDLSDYAKPTECNTAVVVCNQRPEKHVELIPRKRAIPVLKPADKQQRRKPVVLTSWHARSEYIKKYSDSDGSSVY